MKIKELRILNIQSLKGKNMLDFENSSLGQAGIFAITGPTGAGKTTILDAITLAMYGKVHRDKPEEELISYGCGEASAEVLLENMGQQILAKWSIAKARKKAEGKLQPSKREVSVWNNTTGEFEIVADKIKDANKKIVDLTGLDFNRFTRSVLLAQGDFAAFLSSEPRDRKDLLERITGTEIYSEISKASHLRAREAKQHLEKESHSLEMLGIRTPEELESLDTELQEKSKQHKEKSSKLSKLKEQLNLFDSLARQKEVLSLAKKENEKAEQAWTDFLPQLKTLDIHQLVLPLHSKWEKRKEILREGKERDSLKALSTKKLEDLTNDQEKAKEKKSGLEKELQKIKEQFPLVEEKVTAAIKLTEQVLGLQKESQKIQEEQKELLTGKNKVSEEVKKIEEEVKIRVQKNASFESWEKENPSAYLIEKDLPEIIKQVSEIEFLIGEGQNLKAQIDLDQEKIDKKEKTRAEHETLANKRKKDLALAKTNLLDLLPHSNGDNLMGAVTQLRREFKQKVEQKSNLQHYERVLESQSSLKKQLSELRVELDGLKREERKANTTLTETNQKLQSFLQAENEAEKIYNQQLKIQTYTRDRLSVKEGDPCPLCGATHHPEIHTLEAFPDEALKALLRVREDLRAAQEKNQAAQDLMSAIRERVEVLEGKKDKQSFSLVLDLETRIQNNETLIKDTQLSLELSESELQRPGVIKEQMIRLDRFLRDQEGLMQSIDQKEKKKTDCEAALLQATNALEMATFEIKSLSDGQVQNLKKRKTYEENYKEKVRNLDQLLAPHKLTFSYKQPKSVIQKLSETKSTFGKHQSNRNENDLQVAVHKETLKNAQKQLESFSTELEEIQKNLTQLQTTIKQTTQKKQELIGESSPSEYKENLKKQESEWAEKLVFQNEEWQKNLQAIKVEEFNQGNLSRKKEEQDKKLKTLEETLRAELSNFGLDPNKDLEDFFLTTYQKEHLEKQKEKFNEQKIRAKQSLEGQRKSLANIEMQIAPLSDLTKLQQEQSNLQAQDRELAERIGAIKQMLRDEETKRNVSKDLEMRIQSAEKEFKRWESLRQLIGSADGNKFSQFAQGITLGQLIRLANVHLQKLSGRYRIEQKANEPLSLNIVDTYQADNKRSMASLSGGESFLVSLAMALGLSDLAGNKTSIQSLFIDEGFGSLDEQSLNIAIETLENLQSSGKTIGLISHVKDLQERISTQIKVIAGSHGFSSLEIL
ncbi:MAG: AAA family ATPase [Saprospiraceae bacterium]|nr:AAA family ATPase [Saprospiraceae bacterium]